MIYAATPEEIDRQPARRYEAAIRGAREDRDGAFDLVGIWYSGSFDPDDLNLPVISSRIGELARRRALGKAGYAKSRGRTR